MHPRATIVIPTYNGRLRLPLVLDALAQQDTSDGTFEVVIVDNNSNDDTARLTCDSAAAAHLQSRGMNCRVVHEARQGLAYARICGVLEAQSSLICFLDDDNIPTFDYVRNGIDAMTDSSIGLIVSCVMPRWEKQPSASIARRSWIFAASSNLGDSPIDFGAIGSLAPTVGAGLWLRREAFLTAIPWRNSESVLSDRRGRNLSSGQDIEIGLLIGRAGYRRLYLPALKLYHLIPASRLRPSYVCRLIEGLTRSEMTLRALYEGYRHNLLARAWAAIRFLCAAGAGPAVIFCRRDGVREALFILAMRWAQFRGPYPNRTQ